MISDLVLPSFLRNVRSEIQNNISFTPKETDIYRINQSGDLANLDGLDEDALRRLPSLQLLRDALYSAPFREYLSAVTGSGPLSGRKTDMAINVYSPGCHLLCHDDVIGSRRVSYILYLTDPDCPWKEEWGGALRLFPTHEVEKEDGPSIKIPSPDHSVSIPPAFNQLSFFAVQPGESFHDVEEVYAASENPSEGTAEGSHVGRVRMAISGWYHIPQKGEDGFVEGLEEELAAKSSLMQLQGKVDKYDRPQAKYEPFHEDISDKGPISLPTPSSQEDPELTKEDLELLLQFINPHYLTPDTLESVTDMFAEESFLLLDTFLSAKFSEKLRSWLEEEEKLAIPATSDQIELDTDWEVARPPHKHRYLYQQRSDLVTKQTLSPLQTLLKDLVPSKPFQKWLQIATGLTIKTNNLLLRRFRKGHDYTLAQRYDETIPGLELCLNLTPTKGWGEDEENTEVAGGEEPTGGKDESKSHTSTHNQEVGGYLAYMAGDDDDDAGSNAGSNHGIEVPPDMSTGGHATKAKRPKMDPAIYQAQTDEDEDPVLFHMPASWNQLGIVLRDKGTMRFVKYISQQAKGDRWDLVGEFEIEDPGKDDDDVDNDNDEHEKTEEAAQGDPTADHDNEETENDEGNDDSDQSSEP